MRLALLVVFGAWFTAACSEIGNPVAWTTPPSKWSDQRGVLITRSQSLPEDRAESLLRRLSPEVEHVDRQQDEVLTVLEVTARWGRQRPPSRVSLISEFVLNDGSRVLRKWTARTTARTWKAVFFLASVPKSAVSALAPAAR